MTVNLSPGDTSTAKNIPDFIAALRRAWTVYDPAQVTNPECATVKIQYDSIRDDRMSIADDLERLWARLQDGADMNTKTVTTEEPLTPDEEALIIQELGN